MGLWHLCLGHCLSFSSNCLQFPCTWSGASHPLEKWPGWPYLKQWLQHPPSPLSWHALQPLLFVSLLSDICLQFCSLTVLMEASTIQFISATSLWSSLTRVCTLGYGGKLFGVHHLAVCSELRRSHANCPRWCWLSAANPLLVSWDCSFLICEVFQSPG